MTRKTKIALAGSGLLAVALLSALPIADRMATRRYERRIRQAVKQRYGGDLALENFQVSVLASRASVDAIRYEDAPDATYRVVFTCGPTVADIEALSLRPDVVRFREVVLEKPELTLTRTPRGDWDRGIPGVARDLVAFGVRRAKKALGIEDIEVKRPRPGTIEVVERPKRLIEIGRLSIRHARVTYEDHRFTAAPIRLTLRDFSFEGRDLSGADIWRSLLTSEANGTLEVGSQTIDVKGATRAIEGEDRKVWTLEALGVSLPPILGPMLRPLQLDETGGSMDIRLSHLFDVSLAERSAVVIDYDIRTEGLTVSLREASGVRSLLQMPAEKVKAFIDEREGRLELRFSVETAPDLALLGKDAGQVLEAIGRLSYEALRRRLLESMGLSSMMEP